jgi:secreted trypsin-like serine protease
MSFQRSLLLVAALFSGLACSQKQNTASVQADQTAQIVNGRPVVASDAFAKYTVAVGPQDEPVCTGVVIAAHHILTAGHCAEAIDGGYVDFGLDYASASAVARKIVKVTRHPQYCTACTESVGLADTNDLSVVEFSGDLPAGFEPVAFAAQNLVVSKATVHLAGYGADENYDYETIMRVTEVPVNEVGHSEFSTDETKSGSCNGDSGGPAFIEDGGKMLLAGITSRGDSACRAMGVYTIPAAHQAWIQSVITAH